MPMPWPSSVPQVALIDSFDEGPEGNVVEFQPTVGPPIRRRRTAGTNDVITFATTMMFEQYDELLDFWRNDLADGVVTVLRKHPRDLLGPDREFTMTAEPRLKATGPDFGRVSISLRLMG